MRFPLSLTFSMARHIAWNKLMWRRHFPLVLMLEPLHACNLHCAGCGRIREYADTLGERMTLAACLAAATECGAPTVSICGGEPLIYPEITELVDGLLRQGRHLYLCTNGQIMAERIDRFVKLAQRNRRTRGRLFWNVHLDGMAATHDAITGKPGAFDRAIEGIDQAKKAGFYVYTNTTLYRQTGIDELVALGETLTRLRIDGLMIAPAYGYASVRRESEEAASTETDQQSIFLTRQETFEKFRAIRSRMSHFRLTTTPVFMDFLCGEVELPCAAWANPTRNIRGWKGPCYLVTDKHFPTYRALVEETDWSAIGPVHDPRCIHCLMHCGFEPSAVLCGSGWSNLLRLMKWQIE